MDQPSVHLCYGLNADLDLRSNLLPFQVFSVILHEIIPNFSSSINCLTIGPDSKFPKITDRISEGGNAVASVRFSVRPFVPFYLRNRLTVDLELLHVSRS